MVAPSDLMAPEGVARVQPDEAANDSDKSFTVPSNQRWLVLSLLAELASTATVGNRRLVVEVQDSASDVLALVKAGVVQAESLTRYYTVAPGLPAPTAFIDDWLPVPLPNRLLLRAGWKLRVYDSEAVDAAADDLILQLIVGQGPEL